MQFLSRLSLLEVVVAVAILTVALLGLSSSILSSIRLEQENQELAVASYALREKVEELRAFARTNFENIYQEYGPGSVKEFFPIFLTSTPNSPYEKSQSELLPPSSFRSTQGSYWLHAGRIKIVVNETVTAPDLPLVFNSGSLPPLFNTKAENIHENSDVSPLLATTTSDHVKIWYVVVSAVWEGKSSGQVRSLSYQTIIGERLKKTE